MYATIKTGGKQYRVKSGEQVRVESLAADVGATVSFDQVLAVGEGDAMRVGAPLVAGSQVKATVGARGTILFYQGQTEGKTIKREPKKEKAAGCER